MTMSFTAANLHRVKTEIQTRDTVLESLIKRDRYIVMCMMQTYQRQIYTFSWVPVCVCWSAWMPSSRCRSPRRASSVWTLGKCHSWHSASYSWHFDWPQIGHRLRGPPTDRWKNRENKKDRKGESKTENIRVAWELKVSSALRGSWLGLILTC